MIDSPGQAMLERTSVNINTSGIEFRIMVGLPARGRTILGKQCMELLCSLLPAVLKDTIRNYDRNNLKQLINLADEQTEIRKYLKTNQLIAFIGNGSILPRRSGVSQLPLHGKQVVPFLSPTAFEICIPLSNGKKLKGMGISKGITLIVGGGYHGKSTLLQGLERGVYNHELGDGREYVIVDSTAVKIRAEDGRAVNDVNISAFINQLPFEKRTEKFSSDDASGSTSQAANIIEALEMEAKVLFIDEDTSATNFMIRDSRMQKLVNKDQEPITPFIDRVKQLHEEKDVSTVLVIGGSGDYFDVADNVILMNNYQPFDKTEEAKRIASSHITRQVEGDGPIGNIDHRQLHLDKIKSLLDKKRKNRQ
ncbi:MAG: ABC-ATPase domain-containing protein [Bacillus sp. (in: Bacteria)]|nr:ABC-ATPase domain-containing protein [Bacillus sp. (in: firmicutes)]